MSQPPVSPRRPRPMSLWSIVEALQRRLERQGLPREHVDAAVVHTLHAAMRGAAKA